MAAAVTIWSPSFAATIASAEYAVWFPTFYAYPLRFRTGSFAMAGGGWSIALDDGHVGATWCGRPSGVQLR